MIERAWGGGWLVHKNTGIVGKAGPITATSWHRFWLGAVVAM